jgi:hypothetical protein
VAFIWLIAKVVPLFGHKILGIHALCETEYGMPLLYFFAGVYG